MVSHSLRPQQRLIVISSIAATDSVARLGGETAGPREAVCTKAQHGTAKLTDWHRKSRWPSHFISFVTKG